MLLGRVLESVQDLMIKRRCGKHKRKHRRPYQGAVVVIYTLTVLFYSLLIRCSHVTQRQLLENKIVRVLKLIISKADNLEAANSF